MVRFIKFVMLVAIVLLAGASCTTTGHIFGSGEEHTSLTIIQTGDIKGALFPDKDIPHSLAQMATIIQDKRNTTDNLILLDLGNMVREGEIGYYYDYLHTGIMHIQADMLNFLGFDAAVLGSREIGAGMNIINRIAINAQTPLLAANMVNRISQEPVSQAYTIIQRGDLRIAVVGFVAPHARFGIPERNWPSMTIQPVIESAHQWVQIISEQESPDLVIVLIHEDDDAAYRHAVAYDEFNRPKNTAVSIAEELAKRVPGIDMIFTNEGNADAFSQVKSERGDLVYIISSKEYAQSAAVLTVDFTRLRNSELYSVRHVQIDHVQVQNQEPDRDFMTHFSDAISRIDAYRNQQITEIESNIPSTHCLYGESFMARLIHDVQLSLTSAHISFASAPVFYPSQEDCSMLIRDFFRLFPHESYIYSLRLTGQEIKDYLEYSYGGWFNTMQGPYDHLIRFMKDDENQVVRNEDGTPQYAVSPYQFDAAKGIVYTVDVTKPPGNRIEIYQLSNGRPFFLHETYIVAVNSFRYAGGGGHLSEGSGLSPEELARRVITVSSRSLRHHILQRLLEAETFPSAAMDNWSVVPESWGAAGRINDYRLLYE